MLTFAGTVVLMGPTVSESTVLASFTGGLAEAFGALIDETLYPYQREDVLSEDRFRWNCWARQVGKSHVKIVRRLVRGIMRKRDQLFLSAGAIQSRELIDKLHQLCRRLEKVLSVEAFSGTFEGAEYHRLRVTLPQASIKIVGLPANPRTCRGWTADVLLDEFAMHSHDREIWAAVYPSVTRHQGELDCCSTPMGRQNMFYQLGINPNFGRSVLTIHDAVAQGCPANIEELRAGIADEEIWRQEFLCEFVDEATAFLTYEMIGECEDAQLPRELDLAELAEHKGDVVVGVDIGRKHDLTVIWAFEVTGKQLTSLGLIELASMRFREQFEVLSKVLRCRCVRRCCIDSTGLGMQMAEDAVEDFGAHRVEPCPFTLAFKAQAGSALRLKLVDKLIDIPVDEKIRNDLHSVRKIVTTAGNIRLDAPKEDGSHADRFWAAALAVHATESALGKAEWSYGTQVATHNANWQPRGIRDGVLT